MKKSRILITQNSLSVITGGELTVLELATYLKDAGWEVTVYTWYLGGSMESIAKQRNIKVLTENDQESKRLLLGEFDYVWVFNQVLPQSIIADLEKKQNTYPKFLFSHLSVLDTSLIDLPFIYDLENRLSSATLFRAEDAKIRYADKYFGDSIPFVSTYNNPAPVEFSKMDSAKRVLERILVVVSNPASNIQLITELLQEKGYTVDTLDKNSAKPQIITAAVLGRYDLVIASAKTAQYCLCSGVPIYIMDMFGSLGYLNPKNLKKAAKYNFSGSVQNKDDPEYRPNTKTEQAIVGEIIERYGRAQEFQLKNRRSFIKQFSIDFVVPRLLKSVPTRKVVPFDPAYARYVRLAQSMISSFINQINGIYPKRINTLEARISLELGELAKARDALAALEEASKPGIKESIGQLLKAIRGV